MFFTLTHFCLRSCLIASAIIFLLFPLNSYSVEAWVAEEILQQIAELKRDNKQLRDEVLNLKTRLERLEQNKKLNALKTVLKQSQIVGEYSDKAKVVVIEFSDFQCHYCKRHAAQTLPKLKEAYIDKGELLYMVKDFPLSFHPHASDMAAAANCAGEQRKYWPMYQQLFNASGVKNKPLYGEIAASISLNLKDFSNCMNNEKSKANIEEGISLGRSLGISGTPSFFIGRLENGALTDVVTLTGAQPYNRFVGVIDSLLLR